MRAELYETKQKNELLDKVNNYINQTIDYAIKYDYFDEVFPILSKNDLTQDGNFFKLNNISTNTNKNLSSRELKTISYLAPYFKEKIKYNPKEIVRYFKFLGYNINNNDIVVLCLDKTKDYNNNRDNYITFEEYLQFDFNNRSNYVVTNFLYINNFADIIRSDVLRDINEKYVLLFRETLGYLANGEVSTEEASNLYIDGFNRFFDIEYMK